MSEIEKYRRQFKNGTKGQSLIELALLLPIILFMIFSIVEFGRVFYTKIVITNAAREGAYFLSLHPTDHANGIAAVEAEAMNSGISDISVAITPKNMEGYDSIEVTVGTEVPELFILNLLGSSLTGSGYSSFYLSSTVEMMIQ